MASEFFAEPGDVISWLAHLPISNLVLSTRLILLISIKAIAIFFTNHQKGSKTELIWKGYGRSKFCPGFCFNPGFAQEKLCVS